VLIGAERDVRARASILIASALAIASCGSSSPPQPSPCSGGHYCVGVNATGQLNGELTTALPPGNFRAICTVLPKPNVAWVAHVYGALQGATWLLAVQTVQYTGPATYNATVTLGKLPSGKSSVAPSTNYVGQGTAIVGAGGTSAGLTADLKAQAGGMSIHLSGTLSCDKLTVQD
jgi:hypothetical protein